MLDIKLKLVITLVGLWIILHCAAYPETLFADWGARVFGSYVRFLVVIAMVCFLPIVFIGMYWVWSL